MEIATKGYFHHCGIDFVNPNLNETKYVQPEILL